MNIFSLSEITSHRDRSSRLFLEFLRSDSLSAGLYELKSGSEDPQTPHAEDEIYYIIRGRGMIRIDNDHQAVGPGNIIFIAKGADHRFYSITEDLTMLVVFAPPRGSGN